MPSSMASEKLSLDDMKGDTIPSPQTATPTHPCYNMQLRASAQWPDLTVWTPIFVYIYHASQSSKIALG